MKNLKFRAWSKTEKIMSDVKKIDFNNGEVDARCFEETEIEEVELMCSTGLFDKKGVEIFEGDILEIEDEGEVLGNAKLTWDNEQAVFMIEAISIDDIAPFHEIVSDGYYSYTVVGNIYENADLLGKEESDKETITELLVKGTYDKKSERWYIDTDEATVEEMNSFLKEHDLDVFESWLGYLEGGMSDESLAFINILQTIEDEIELADGSKIKLVEG